MTSSPDATLLQVLNPADPAQADRLMRAALAGLLRWQLSARPAPLQRLDAAPMARGLEDFASACAARGPGGRWTDRERATWDRVAAALVEQAQAQPFVAVHGHWTADRLVLREGAWTAAAAGADALAPAPATASGPVCWDLVGLLRDPAFDWEEAQEIDWAIRWWDAARHAGLPVDADFGAFWRAHEWLGLQRQLVHLGQRYREPPLGPPAAPSSTEARLLSGAGRTALRYGPLKPLLRLLEPLSGAQVSAGFTF
jgi:aminoglycoside/choline kinase family phosphotransferase